MEIAGDFFQLLLNSLLLTLQVSLLFFGGIFIVGLLLFLLARFTRNIFAKTFGYRAEIFITAWIGTPVHEIGHAVFCLLFGHRIRKITLFNPNAKDGSLGSVEHSYNPRNFYQRAGNFFIGAGPLIFGSLVIMTLGYFLLPATDGFSTVFTGNSPVDFSDPQQIHWFLQEIAIRAFDQVKIVFTLANAGDWKFWLFLYLSLAISAHMELSPPDLKQMWSGLWIIILLIFVINLIYLIFFRNYENLIYQGVVIFALLNRLLVFGLIFSLFNFLLTWGIASIFGVLTSGKVPNPMTR